MNIPLRPLTIFFIIFPVIFAANFVNTGTNTDTNVPRTTTTTTTTSNSNQQQNTTIPVPDQTKIQTNPASTTGTNPPVTSKKNGESGRVFKSGITIILSAAGIMITTVLGVYIWFVRSKKDDLI